MSALPWIIFGIAAGLLIGFVAVTSLRSKKKKHRTDYRAIFYLGLVFFVLGLTSDNNVFFILGLAYIAMALANKKKMALKKKYKLTKREMKMIRVGAIAILILGILVAFILVVLNADGLQARLFKCRMINDFESCAAAGNAVMESYPRQCRACDQTFMEKIERTDCTTDSDCIVFGRDGDCNCGCYRVGSAPVQRIEGCFCAAPTACECVNGECEGVFE